MKKQCHATNNNILVQEYIYMLTHFVEVINKIEIVLDIKKKNETEI